LVLKGLCEVVVGEKAETEELVCGAEVEKAVD
jgi:hypothetical protein